jgi:hypothetical protein
LEAIVLFSSVVENPQSNPKNGGRFMAERVMNVARRTEINHSTAATASVRYVGFEAIPGGRRLRFRVKSNGESAVEVTFAISDVAFTDITKVSIQDAAPMAYEKLVELLASEQELDATTLCLTMADITDYRDRHSSRGRQQHGDDWMAETDIAA